MKKQSILVVDDFVRIKSEVVMAQDNFEGTISSKNMNPIATRDASAPLL